MTFRPRCGLIAPCVTTAYRPSRGPRAGVRPESLHPQGDGSSTPSLERSCDGRYAPECQRPFWWAAQPLSAGAPSGSMSSYAIATPSSIVRVPGLAFVADENGAATDATTSSVAAPAKQPTRSADADYVSLHEQQLNAGLFACQGWIAGDSNDEETALADGSGGLHGAPVRRDGLRRV